MDQGERGSQRQRCACGDGGTSRQGRRARPWESRPLPVSTETGTQEMGPKSGRGGTVWVKGPVRGTSH